LAELVAPPHIAISLKHCLLSVESIDDKTPSNLFIAASSRTPMEDAGRVSILAYPGPGCSPSDPMALVVKISDLGRRPVGEKKPESAFLPSHEGPTPFEAQYSTCYKGLFNVFQLADYLLQYITEFTNNTLLFYQRNQPTLIIPQLGALALTPFHPLIPPHPSYDVYLKSKNSTTRKIHNSL
jgi:hypothetical protein